jgi:hypothetical protein
VAAYWNQQWALGAWQAYSAGEPVQVEIGQTGSLQIDRTGADCDGPLALAAGGWSLSDLLKAVGLQGLLTARGSVVINGLPEGSVAVSLCGEQRTVSVAEGKAAEIRF